MYNSAYYVAPPYPSHPPPEANFNAPPHPPPLTYPMEYMAMRPPPAGGGYVTYSRIGADDTNRGMLGGGGGGAIVLDPSVIVGIKPTTSDSLKSILNLGHPPDMPSYKSLPGCIITLILSMLILSLFICLGRSDFNFVFYLMGYYVWCIDADPSDYEGLHRMMKSIQQYSIALCLACFVDVMWLFMGFSTWLCEEGGVECFQGDQDSKLRWTHGMHLFVLYLSMINFVFKLAVATMSFVWVQRQQKSPMTAASMPSSPSNHLGSTLLSQSTVGGGGVMIPR
eukprot:GHVQ01035613.1.p1 GENE.GHVQ01035613.1~~GHVQ01035613.1.p1  ORF type:complete len:281 (+),score=52.27 GHVQ01035613.1:262-1104(+)